MTRIQADLSIVFESDSLDTGDIEGIVDAMIGRDAFEDLIRESAQKIDLDGTAFEIERTDVEDVRELDDTD